jgi:hypothetical protein
MDTRRSAEWILVALCAAGLGYAVAKDAIRTDAAVLVMVGLLIVMAIEASALEQPSRSVKGDGPQATDDIAYPLRTWPPEPSP